jgi:hypothetical protein
MWVIVVNNNTSDHRDSYLSSLFGDQPKNTGVYVSSLNSTKYSTTAYFGNAKIFKSQSRAENFVKKFNDDTNKNQYTNKFSWIHDKHLSIRKLTKDEWDSLIDTQIRLLKARHDRALSKLEMKKYNYKNA